MQPVTSKSTPALFAEGVIQKDLGRRLKEKMSLMKKAPSFMQSVQDYCRYRWLAFQFLKRNLKDPLSNFDLLDLEDE